MLNTLPWSSYTRTVLQQSRLQDCLFLIVVASLSMSNYICSLGFYSDDWALLYSMHFSPDQSFAGIFTAVNSSQDSEIRPIQFLSYASLYKLFALIPLGYHVLNGIFFMLGLVLLYLILITLHQPRVLALATSVIYMLLPNYSTDRFWISVQANLGMFFAFFGIYAHLRALRCRKAVFWGWQIFAILCVIASGLTYEVFLPLVLVTTVFLFASELAKDWPLTVAGRAITRAAVRQGVIVITVILVVLVKMVWASRAQPTVEMGIISYGYWVIKIVVKSFVYSYGYHLLGLPFTVLHSLRDDFDWIMVTTAGVIGILIFVRMYTSWGMSSGAVVTSRAKMLMYVACGVIVFVAGYSIASPNPVKNGINNRIAIAGTLGVAVSVVGLLGMLSSLAPGVWRKVSFSAAVGVIGMSGSLTIEVLGSLWIQSYRSQKEYLSDIRSHLPAIPAGTTLLLDGVCPYSGPAPVFEQPWDLSSALSILYDHPGISANIVTRWLRVEPNGLITPFCCGEVKYPFDHLFVYHFGRKISYPLPDADAAQSYFSKISTDRGSRCPVDFYGNGVEVLGGFGPMLGRNPYAPRR